MYLKHIMILIYVAALLPRIHKKKTKKLSVKKFSLLAGTLFSFCPSRALASIQFQFLPMLNTICHQKKKERLSRAPSKSPLFYRARKQNKTKQTETKTKQNEKKNKILFCDFAHFKKVLKFIFLKKIIFKNCVKTTSWERNI